MLCGVDRRRLHSAADIDVTLLQLMSELLTDLLVTSRAQLAATDSAARAQSEADTDALTGLLNRRGWGRLAEGLHMRHRSLGDPYSVLMVDLDRLKQVNDAAGHAAGDKLLRIAARTLRDTVRDTDAVAGGRRPPARRTSWRPPAGAPGRNWQHDGDRASPAYRLPAIAGVDAAPSRSRLQLSGPRRASACRR